MEWEKYQNKILNKALIAIQESKIQINTELKTAKNILRLCQKELGADHLYRVKAVEIKQKDNNYYIAISFMEKPQSWSIH